MEKNEIYYDFKDVRERDMDFMMMEEFCASQEFADLFLAKVGKAGAEVVRVYHSKYEKHIFITAPENYLRSNHEARLYPNSVSYEEIEEYMQTNTDVRYQFKLQMISKALGANSHWVNFSSPAYGSVIVHKGKQGYVDLQFGGMGDDLDALSNVLRNSERIYDRILIAPTPSDRWVEYIITAMNNNQMIEIYYKEYDASEGESIVIEPYCLKTYHHRWYVLGKLTDETMKVYGLDRVDKVGIINKTFTIDPDFNAEEYFAEYYGVRLDRDVKVERVVLRAHLNERFILAKQPVHHTQKLIAQGDNCAGFELTIRPTFDFVTYLESQGRFIEVLEPLWLRKELVRVHSEAIERNSIL